MLYHLDTDTSSYFIKGRHPHLDNLRARVSSLTHAELAISALTKAELLYGLRRLPDSHDLHVSASSFLSAIQVFDWPDAATDLYAHIRHHLTTTGQLIGELDMLLAAHALSLDAVVVSNNTRHFERLSPPLRIENWAEG